MASMTPASADYFEKVANQWDRIRSGYFTEAVRQSAIRKAYLRPDMVVADVGAGTGFMAAGLAPLVKQVHVLDGAPAMLEVARGNLPFLRMLYFNSPMALRCPCRMPAWTRYSVICTSTTALTRWRRSVK